MSEEHFVRRSTRSTVSKKRSLVDFEDPGESSTAISTASTTRTKSTKKSKTSKSKTSAPDKYAHLKGVPDAIDYNLICLLIGLNPGIKTAEVGHAYVISPFLNSIMIRGIH